MADRAERACWSQCNLRRLAPFAFVVTGGRPVSASRVHVIDTMRIIKQESGLATQPLIGSCWQHENRPCPWQKRRFVQAWRTGAWAALGSTDGQVDYSVKDAWLGRCAVPADAASDLLAAHSDRIAVALFRVNTRRPATRAAETHCDFVDLQDSYMHVDPGPRADRMTPKR